MNQTARPIGIASCLIDEPTNPLSAPGALPHESERIVIVPLGVQEHSDPEESKSLSKRPAFVEVAPIVLQEHPDASQPTAKGEGTTAEGVVPAQIISQTDS